MASLEKDIRKPLTNIHLERETGTTCRSAGGFLCKVDTWTWTLKRNLVLGLVLALAYHMYCGAQISSALEGPDREAGIRKVRKGKSKLLVQLTTCSRDLIVSVVI